MKCYIDINGQPSGNLTLSRAITGGTVINSRFSNFRVAFPTIKSAREALRLAFAKLKKDEPDFAKGGIRFHSFGLLFYDASSAVLVN